MAEEALGVNEEIIMKKEASLKIINEEIARWERIKDLVTTLEKGKMYKIIFKFFELDNRKNNSWVERESVFIGTLKEFNKASINMEVHSIKDVNKSGIAHEINSHKLLFNKNINKKFHCSIKLDDFKSWEEWVPNSTEAPLMVNYDFISEKMRNELFGA